MIQLRKKYMLVAYAITLMFVFVLSQTKKVDALTETVNVVTLKENRIYELEINSIDGLDVAVYDVLSDDEKYILHPDQLDTDISMSQVVSKDIDFTKADVQNVEIEVLRFSEANDGKHYVDSVKETIAVRFVDTTAPVLELKQDSISITTGQRVNPEDYVENISDNSGYYELAIDDEFNANQVGKQAITFTATDGSGNVTVRTLEVNVQNYVTYAPVSLVDGDAIVASTSGDVYQVLALINAEREARGLHPLQLGGPLEQQAAATRAAEARGYVSHQRPDGRGYATAFTDLGVYHGMPIEVLTFYGNTPQAKVGWWMSSPAHAGVLMRSNITHIALGESGGMWAGIVY